MIVCLFVFLIDCLFVFRPKMSEESGAWGHSFLGPVFTVRRLVISESENHNNKKQCDLLICFFVRHLITCIDVIFPTEAN